ncbi:MAG: hypothetical protein IPG00_15525 [Saprospiraceae bacterium]|nr:hypothetical protein [Saprospiraceae bacterium]
MDDKPEEIFELERALGIDSVDDYVWDGEKVTELKSDVKRHFANCTIKIIRNFRFIKK